MAKIFFWLKNNYILLTLLVVAVVLRLYHCDFQSIWVDEIYTMLESNPRLTLSEFDAVMVKREGMGHLYFFLLRLLYGFFGYSTLVARAFSGIVGAISVYGIYLFGKAIYNKNAGLIAAFLLTVNSYHIFYSQEARPYALFVLFTVFSFYRLVVFINKPSARNALYYGIFSGLIVNAHFVGLITLLGQGILLLLILILTEKEKKALFFKYCLYAGVVALVLILPTYKMFFKMMNYKSGWLQLPGSEGFVNIFKEFMGSTELLYFIFSLLIIFYCIHLFRQKGKGITLDVLKKNKILFSGLVFFCWMFFSISISIIKSYVSEPMILSRYFIHLLPALLTLFAISIELIRNRISKMLLIIVITVFALLDLFVVKNYYNTPNKTQFRETSEFIIDNNSNDAPVVTSLGWYLAFFLDNGTQNFTIIDRPLEDYVNAMMKNPVKIKSFWYMDGHGRPYKVSDEVQKFLDKNFVVEKSYEGFDCWTRYYRSLKKSKENVNGLRKIKTTGNTIIYNIEKLEQSGNILTVVGWGFLEDTNSEKSKVQLCLIKGNKVLVLPITPIHRPDVTNYFKSKIDIAYSGFKCTYNTVGLESGEYQIGVRIDNKEERKSGFAVTEEIVVR